MDNENVNGPRDLSHIPAAACAFTVSEVEFGDNGEGAKSAPVKLVARTGKPIEHWFWGRIVHDLAGMRMHKPRLPIDYAHDSKEVLGYLNRFDITSGDLVVSGALVPFKDSDRATEIMHKTRAGVPYEASINFGGDGIKVEDVPEGFVTQVNGFEFSGPGVVVREWPLRGVAICPYGADANTSTSVLANSNKTFSAAVFPAPKATTKDADMSKQPVEVAAQAEAPKADATQTNLSETPVEGKPVEAVAPVAQPAVETPSPEGDKLEAPAPVAAVPEPEKKPELSREEFLKIVDEFGADTAAQVVKDGGDYNTALKLAYSKEKTARLALESKCAEMSATKAGTPAPVADATKTQSSLFKTGK